MNQRAPMERLRRAMMRAEAALAAPNIAIEYQILRDQRTTPSREHFIRLMRSGYPDPKHPSDSMYVRILKKEFGRGSRMTDDEIGAAWDEMEVKKMMED